MIVLFTATAFACHYNDWYFAKGLYFSLTSMSTGGLVSLPDDAGSWQFGLLGLFGALGVPLMVSIYITVMYAVC